MTDLLQKLEEARGFLDDSNDEMASDAFDTINGIISDIHLDYLQEMYL